MKKYYLAALFLAVALVGASTPALGQSKSKPTDNSAPKDGAPTTDIPASFTLLTPRDGDVLRGGQQVLVTWDLTLDKTITEHPFAEMEFFVDTGEGVHMRITPQLSVKARSFNWTVPNLNTRTARLTLQCGIEGEGDRYRFGQSGVFSISSIKLGNSILLNAMKEEVAPGEEVEISWTSNLDGYTNYDVMVSYDRGAHFHKAGSTTETRYALKIDEDFAGAITVQIVSRRADGSKVKSDLTDNAMVRIGSKEDR